MLVISASLSLSLTASIHSSPSIRFAPSHVAYSYSHTHKLTCIYINSNHSHIRMFHVTIFGLSIIPPIFLHWVFLLLQLLNPSICSLLSSLRGSNARVAGSSLSFLLTKRYRPVYHANTWFSIFVIACLAGSRSPQLKPWDGHLTVSCALSCIVFWKRMLTMRKGIL